MINHDTRRKPVKEADRRVGPYPYYGASGVVDFVDGYLFDGEYLLIAEDGENLRSRNTPIAFRATGRFWVNNHAHIVQGTKVARTRFLEYAVLAADIGPYLTGAVMPKLTQANLGRVLVVCPPLREQDQIIDVLGGIDDRISLLRQTNTTLESIAQALYKSWFIDFDPVRAKSEGREPEGMDAATAALFPAEFEESALGLIPKGWRAGTFGELAESARDSKNPQAFPDEAFEHYSLPAFDDGRLPAIELGGSIKSSKFVISGGSILQSKLNPHIPRVWFPSRVGVRAVCSTEFVPWTPRHPATSELVYCVLRDDSFRTAVRALVTGTSNSHQRVKADQVSKLPIAIPAEQVVEAFTANVRPMLTQVGDNLWKGKTLTGLRDLLLPRLISGTLRIPEAREQLEDAVS